MDDSSLFYYIFFQFVPVLLTTKPIGGGTKGLSGLTTKEITFFAASLSHDRKLQVWQFGKYKCSTFHLNVLNIFQLYIMVKACTLHMKINFAISTMGVSRIILDHI